MKQYVYFLRDHSISMRGYHDTAMNDFNGVLESTIKGSVDNRIDTVVNVFEFSEPRSLKHVVIDKSVTSVKNISGYDCYGGSTALYSAILAALQHAQSQPDANDPETTFLFNVFTDGVDNMSGSSDRRATVSMVNRVLNTDRYTIAIRGPASCTAAMIAEGMPSWLFSKVEATAKDIQKSTANMRASTTSYFTDRAAGVKAKKANFYVDDASLKTADVKKNLTEITKLVKVMKVGDIQPKTWISKWYETQRGPGTYMLGSCYYQLSKTEIIQPHKKIIVWDKKNNKYYTGADARYLLGLPEGVDTKVAPGQNPQFEVFVQSTSINRHLVARTNLLVYTG